ncbi:MAG: hypothetical protein ACRET1_04425, partial [Burkholderiales bacterium]
HLDFMVGLNCGFGTLDSVQIGLAWNDGYGFHRVTFLSCSVLGDILGKRIVFYRSASMPARFPKGRVSGYRKLHVPRFSGNLLPQQPLTDMSRHDLNGRGALRLDRDARALHSRTPFPILSVVSSVVSGGGN